MRDTETSLLIETSFADAIAIIASAAELPKQTRRHWTTSLRQVAKALDRPMETIPARYSAVRADLLHLHHAPLGLTPKTLQNHKSNTKSALLWLAREKGIPEHGAPLSAAWEELRRQVGDKLVRWRLSSLLRFCSANGIAPAEVNEAVVDRLIEYRTTIGQPADAAFRRLLARAWNGCVDKVSDWPSVRLAVPAIGAAVEHVWEAFPEGLRRDVDSYLQGLTKVRRNRAGQRLRPAKPSTIHARRAELQAAARMAVKIGVPIEQLTSLAALLAPEVAERVLDAYWAQNGQKPKTFTINLAVRFLSIARYMKCLDEADLERLDETRAELEQYRDNGITEKNIAFLRQVLTPGLWDRVIMLPFQMMAQARAQVANAPVRAAVTAQLAVAIAILAFAPVRLANLTASRLDENLIKPGGPESNYWLVFPDYDVKNRLKLEHRLNEQVTRLINEYVHDFRPVLLRRRNDDWLFPGQHKGAKGKTSFSGQITERILKATGLRMTAHQFRHAAGALILWERPGEFELVRQLLGHRRIETTMQAYVGLESIRSSDIYGKIVMGRLAEAAE